jgi:ATP-dependent Clp protease protease subunit
MFLPYVTEKTGRSSKPIDLPSRLLQDRIVYLGGAITPEGADMIIMQLLWLNSDDSDKPIDLYINSPGGCVYSGLAIRDVIYNISPKVNTIGVGMCASMGAYLLSSGTGERKTTENCRIMIHSVSTNHGGTYHDIEVDFIETKYTQDKLIHDIADFTNGKCSVEDIKNMTQRDKYMSPKEAVEYGFIDKII